MKLVSNPYFFSIYNAKCQLLLLYLTYAFVGRIIFFCIGFDIAHFLVFSNDDLQNSHTFYLPIITSIRIATISNVRKNKMPS